MRSVSFSYLILIPNLLHLKILKNFFVYCTVHWSRHLHHPRHILSDIMLGRRNWRTKCFVQQFHGRIESMSWGARCCWPSKGTTTLALTPKYPPPVWGRAPNPSKFIILCTSGKFVYF